MSEPMFTASQVNNMVSLVVMCLTNKIDENEFINAEESPKYCYEDAMRTCGNEEIAEHAQCIVAQILAAKLERELR